MQNMWKHFEKWRGPAGFVAMADAVCAFNPVYAQGMTSAPRYVRASAREVDRRKWIQLRCEFPDGIFSSVRKLSSLRQPWGLSVARDRRALGQTDASEGAMAGEAWERVLREGAGVPVIAEALFNVINLNRPPESLMADSEFLAAVNEIMQRPPNHSDRSPADLPPYPPAAIAN